MKEAGYEADQVSFVTEVMLTRNIPDPRDIRKFDVLGPMGTINFRLLEQVRLPHTRTPPRAGCCCCVHGGCAYACGCAVA
eukprot:356116-Chlamydomonas_euryale.AAC.3